MATKKPTKRAKPSTASKVIDLMEALKKALPAKSAERRKGA